MPLVRPHVEVDQTTLRHPKTGKLYPFNGLKTRKAIPRGGFIGFYNGTFRDGTARKNGMYTFQLSYMYIEPQRGNEVVSGNEFPIAMCNEPGPGETANVMMREFGSNRHKNKDGTFSKVIPQLTKTKKITALGYYACRDIAPDEELFIHYGDAYNRRGYKTDAEGNVVGTSCNILVSELESPEDMMSSFGMNPFVPEDCFFEE